VLGPATSSAVPSTETVDVRRYRCRACKAVLVVGPRGLLPRRRYSAGAIGLALAVYAGGATGAETRERTSPARVVGPSATERWATLTRWVDAARRGEILRVYGIADLPRRRAAEHVALALAARAGHVFGDDLERSAFEGAALAA
jgi:hypothetical protein